MNVDVKELFVELKMLRKGRGLSVVPARGAFGPAVRAVCGASQDEDLVTLHRKVVALIRERAAELPEDLHEAALAAFGLGEGMQAQFLKDRVTAAARRLGRDERTARRRMDEALQQLAELAVTGTAPQSPAPAPGHSWHTEQLRVALLVDGPKSEALVLRRIVADEDGIEELNLALTLTSAARPGDPVQESEFGIDVFFGGLLVDHAMESSERIGLALRLPAPLRREQRHDFLLRIRAELVAPHYVSVLRDPCDLFDLHVRFVGEPPVHTSRLDGIFQDDVRDSLVAGIPLELDASGALHTEFRALKPGFAYGVRWQP